MMMNVDDVDDNDDDDGDDDNDDSVGDSDGLVMVMVLVIMIMVVMTMMFMMMIVVSKAIEHRLMCLISDCVSSPMMTMFMTVMRMMSRYSSVRHLVCTLGNAVISN